LEEVYKTHYQKGLEFCSIDNYSFKIDTQKSVTFYYSGLYFRIKKYTKTGWWPGGKPEPDNLTNMIGDTIFCILGWIMAYLIDKKYEKDFQKRGRLV
jgi:hypothetical protein